MIDLIIIIAEEDSVSKVHEQTRYPETTRTLMLDLLAGMENIRVGRKSLFIHVDLFGRGEERVTRTRKKR